MDEPTALARIESAHRMLVEAKNLPDVLRVVVASKQMEQLARQIKLGRESQNMAAELALRAERKAGELLKKTPKNEGAVRRSDSASERQRPATIPELGITHRQSSDWQHIAAVPEDVFEAAIEETKTAGEELTTASMVRLAKKEQHRAVKEMADEVLSIAADVDPDRRDRYEEAKLLAALSIAIVAARSLLRLKPEALAPAATDDTWRQLDGFISDCRRWFDDLESRRPRGLRIVGGR